MAACSLLIALKIETVNNCAAMKEDFIHPHPHGRWRKVMLNLALAISALLAILVLLALIAVLGLWMKGIGSIALPGLGIIVGTQLLLILLIVAEVWLILLAAYLVRFIPFVRELTDMLASIEG
jgi:hypothetical protein